MGWFNHQLGWKSPGNSAIVPVLGWGWLSDPFKWWKSWDKNVTAGSSPGTWFPKHFPPVKPCGSSFCFKSHCHLGFVRFRGYQEWRCSTNKKIPATWKKHPHTLTKTAMDTDGKHPAFLGAFFLPVRRIHFPNMTMRLHGGVAPILFTEALPGRLGGKLPRLCFFGGRIFWAQEIAGYQGDSKWRMIPDRWRSLYLSLIFSKRSLNYHKKVRYNWQAVCFSEYFFRKRVQKTG